MAQVSALYPYGFAGGFRTFAVKTAATVTGVDISILPPYFVVFMWKRIG